MAERPQLRLFAEDADDLKVISAATQDAVTRAEHLKYDRRQHRFTLEINRFRWEAGGAARERVRALLAVDGVLGVRTRAISKADPDVILSLLQVVFEPASEPPEGVVRLLFAGDGEIAVEVEALDVSLIDSDYVWPTRHQPDHQRRRR